MGRLFVLLLLALPVAAQTEADLKPLFDAFAKERAASPAPPELLATADKLAKRAAEAVKTENFGSAARLLRDARWAIPTTPANVPDGVKVIGYNRLRHGEKVNAVRYNRDGTKLLTASNDLSVRVWDVATGRELACYHGHTPSNTKPEAKSGTQNNTLPVSDAVFIDDDRIASAGGQQIHVWDIRTGKLLTLITGHSNMVKSLGVSDDARRLVSGGDDKIVRVWNLDNGKEVYSTAPLSQRIEAVAWQPKGKHVAAVDADGNLSVYDPAKPGAIYKVQATDGNNAIAHAVRFTPDGTKIFTGGADKVPKLYPAPAADGSVPPNVAVNAIKLPAHSDAVLGVDISGDGKYFASGGRDRSVRVVDALGQVVRTFRLESLMPSSKRVSPKPTPGPNEDPGPIALAVAIRPDGKQLAVAGDDGSVRVIDFLATDDHRTAKESTEPLWATAVNTEGTLFAAAGADKSIRVFTLNGKLQSTLSGSTGAVTSIAFFGNDQLLSAGGDKLLRLWDVKTGKETATWPGHTAAVLALATDGKSVISGSADKAVIGWANGKPAWTWTARSAITALAVTGDRVIVGSADGGLTVLAIKGDTPTVASYVNAHVSGVAAVVLNKDATKFATVGGDGVPKIWSFPATGEPTTLLRLVPDNKPVSPSQVALSAVAWSPDGEQIACGGADRLVRIYNAIAGGEVRTLRGCADWVTSLAYAPEGDRLIAVAADGAARVFDVMRLDAASRGGHVGSTRAVALRGDGVLATVGDDKTIRLWNPATGIETGSMPVDAPKLFTSAFAGNTLITGGSDKKLRAFDLDTKKELASLGVGDVYGITPSPDGKTLGVWSRGGGVDVFGLYDAGIAKEPKVLTVKPQQETKDGKTYKVEIRSATFSKDLKTLAVGDDSGTVTLYDTATNEPIGKPWPITKSRIMDIGFSPDGERIAVMDIGGTLTVATMKDRMEVAKATGPADGINGLIVAPQGNRFVILDPTGNVHVYDFAGKELKVIGLPCAANGGCFSVDGKTLYTANADGSAYAVTMP